MGDKNQLEWVRTNRHLANPPILEIGSRHYATKSAIGYRSLFDGLEYVGVDMSEGNNVDMVVDFTADFSVVREKLGREFGAIICCSVIEHVDNIFKFAQNLTRITKPGGTLFLSAPFTWRFHGYPNDFWRFTPAGLKYLFPDFDFAKELNSITSNAFGESAGFDEDPNQFVVYRGSITSEESKVRPPPSVSPIGPPPRMFTRAPYLLVPSMINLVGTKKPKTA
ncbi:MAG TPA: class I SAM-dependent methyltransferase [Verrucomicrobiae bacterium]